MFSTTYGTSEPVPFPKTGAKLRFSAACHDRRLVMKKTPDPGCQTKEVLKQLAKGTLLRIYCTNGQPSEVKLSRLMPSVGVPLLLPS
jgi:hypothetical protein